MQPGGGFGLFIDAVGAEEHKVDADGLFGQDDQEVFAPAFEGGYFASGDAGKVDFRIAVGPEDLPAAEFSYLFFQYDDRWAFGHINGYAKGDPGRWRLRME